MPNHACLFKFIDVMLHTINTHSTLSCQLPDAAGRLFFQGSEDNFFGVSLGIILFSLVVAASLPVFSLMETSPCLSSARLFFNSTVSLSSIFCFFMPVPYISNVCPSPFFNREISFFSFTWLLTAVIESSLHKRLHPPVPSSASSWRQLLDNSGQLF